MTRNALYFKLLCFSSLPTTLLRLLRWLRKGYLVKSSAPALANEETRRADALVRTIL